MENDGGTYEKNKLKLTICPTALEGKKIAIEVRDEDRFIPVQFLPRLVLNFEFDFEQSHMKGYPL